MEKESERVCVYHFLESIKSIKWIHFIGALEHWSMWGKMDGWILSPRLYLMHLVNKLDFTVAERSVAA